MDISPGSFDEREILIRTIDLLSMEILRLKSENENLKISVQTFIRKTHNKASSAGTNRTVNVWNKALIYYRREGFRNTLIKIISKLSGH